MIQTKADLYLHLREDSKRNGVTKNYFKYLILIHLGSEHYNVFRYIRCLRYCEYHYNNRQSFYHKIKYYYYKIKLYRLGLKYNIHIGLNVCGYGLRIMHLSGGGGVLINAAKVGNYCGFNSGVLIGNKDSEDNIPTIGDFVGFGPGSKAFGKIQIGDNVFVAPNAVVIRDTPSNVIVGGIPAKILKTREERN